MKVITATSARANLFGLIDETAEAHEPVMITTKRSNAVLISEEDWRDIEATLYLSANSVARQSILDAANTPDEDFLSEEEFMRQLNEDDKE